MINKNDEIGKSLLLDSRLISATILFEKSLKLYDLKIVTCGNYLQVYYYENRKVLRKKEDKSDDFNLKIISNCSKNLTLDNKNISSNQILDRNIIRSKLDCQRLAKCNSDEWKTFITLTFAENVKDVSWCYKKLKNFFDKISRKKKDFKYICIPEFQKRGAIHYHLLSNISINDDKLVYLQLDNKKYSHVKYWDYGFNDIENISGDIKKIVGYISKYMTKQIDNRLFNHRRYYSSKNLLKPIEAFIDLSNKKHCEFYNNVLKNKTLIYENKYENIYDKSQVTFMEYLK